MIRIGFLDYFLDEWHANHFPDNLKKAAQIEGTEATVTHAWAERDSSPKTGKTTAEWCAQFGVTPCNTIEEVCKSCDAICIFAPDDPDRHLAYAKRAFPFRKPVYIDKTFAPTEQEGAAIFALAAETGTPVCSSSALRFSEEREEVEASRITVQGSGPSAVHYLVHLFEPLVATLGVGATGLTAERDGDAFRFLVHYADGREGCALFAPKVPFAIREGIFREATEEGITSDFFLRQTRDILRFFDRKTPSYPQSETLEILRLRDLALAAMN